MIVAETNILINRCTDGAYLRFWHSQGGWHYWLVDTKRQNELSVQNGDNFTQEDFSRISKVVFTMSKDIASNHKCGAINLTAAEKDTLVGMLEAEKVEWYRGGIWQEVEIKRQSFTVRSARSPLFSIEFEFEHKNYLDDVE